MSYWTEIGKIKARADSLMLTDPLAPALSSSPAFEIDGFGGPGEFTILGRFIVDPENPRKTKLAELKIHFCDEAQLHVRAIEKAGLGNVDV